MVRKHTAEEFTAALTAANLPAWLKWRVAVRPRRRKAEIATDHTGTVIAVPPTADPADIAAFVQSKLPALARHVARSADFDGYTVKELVSGEGFRFLGQNYRLHLVDDGPPIVHGPGPSTWSGVRTYRLTVRRDAASAALIVDWYRRMALEHLDVLMPRVLDRLGVDDAPRWEVRGLYAGESRSWATYRPRTHKIRFHWAAFQLDRAHVEYLAFHEAAHALLRGADGHGPRWRAVMDRALCGWEETRRRRDEQARRGVWMGEVKTPAAPVPASAPFVSEWAAL